MVGAEVLREYLVKLGFSIDNTAQAKIKETLTVLEKQLDSLSKNKAFAVLTHGAMAYVGAISAVVTASAGLMHHIAEQDMQYQKIALRMHLTKEAAKELTISQNALGASFAEMVWNPELRSHYHELRQLVKETALPADSQTQLKKIRDIGFEFTKFKVLMISASERIVYYLSKMIDLDKIKNWLKSINDWLKANLSKWTGWIADFFNRVFGVGKLLIEMVKSIVSAVISFINIIPKAEQVILGLFAAIALGMKLNPTILMLSAFFLMLESFWTYLEGKRTGRGSITVFGDLWRSLDTIFVPFKDALKGLNEALKGIFGQSFEMSFWNAFAGTIRVIAASIALIVQGYTALIRLADYAVQKFNETDDPAIVAKYKKRKEDVEKNYGYSIAAISKSGLGPIDQEAERHKINRAMNATLAEIEKQKDIELSKGKVDISGTWKKIGEDYEVTKKLIDTLVNAPPSRIAAPPSEAKGLIPSSTAGEDLVQKYNRSGSSSMLAAEGAGTGDINYYLSISGDIILPNVQNAEQFVKGLKILGVGK